MYLKDDEKGAASGGAQQPGAGEGERRRAGCRAAERRGGRVRWPRPEQAAFLRGETYRRIVRR